MPFYVIFSLVPFDDPTIHMRHDTTVSHCLPVCTTINPVGAHCTTSEKVEEVSE